MYHCDDGGINQDGSQIDVSEANMMVSPDGNRFMQKYQRHTERDLQSTNKVKINGNAFSNLKPSNSSIEMDQTQRGVRPVPIENARNFTEV